MDNLKILVAGDFCPRFNQKELLDETLQNEITKEIAPLASSHDFAMLNVETVFSDKDTPIVKSGPNIRTNLEYLGFLKKFNFNIGACANNHMGDHGDDALLETIEHVKDLGMMTVGAGKNKADAEKALFVEKNGIKLAIVNCAEHEFGIAGKDKPGMAGLDFYDTSKIIIDAKKKADVVLVFIHGGNEHNPLPRPGMKKLCHFFAECGASAVVVGHAHCRQGYEVYEGTPIFYGMGNFYMQNKKQSYGWEHGYMVSLEFTKEKCVKYEIIPYYQAYDGTKFEISKGEEKVEALSYIDHISEVMNTEDLYEKLTLAWAVYYLKIANGWHVGEKREFFELKDRPFNDFSTLFIRNTFTCESHAELMANFLKAYCEEGLDGIGEYIKMIETLQNGGHINL